MQRYLIDGLLRDLRAGRRVLYVAARQVEVQSLFYAITAGHLRDDETCHRVNGDLRIKQADGDGVIYFRSALSRGHRGIDADVLVVDDAHGKLSIEQCRELVPCVAASRVPHAEQLVLVG